MAPIESLEQVIQSAQGPISQDPTAHSNQLRNLAKKPGGNIILGSLLPVAPPTPVEGDAPPEPPASTQNDPLDLIDPAHSTLVALFILYVTSAYSPNHGPNTGGVGLLEYYQNPRVLGSSLMHLSHDACSRNIYPRGTKPGDNIDFRRHPAVDEPREEISATCRVSNNDSPVVTCGGCYAVSQLRNLYLLYFRHVCRRAISRLWYPYLQRELQRLTLSDIQYTDNLQYHYLGGCIYGALKRYKEAEDFFETVRRFAALAD
ncbi:hypothetical protein AG1IA_09477 [Rhizoctonia solani AG-1 IA]|uniref:COP9 signalosome complex subunit 3 N-terminal helical repeats domain-containing protein n=1 Tax=Thanatephorus cucumeris (strain AG1-IA) TaxID=983506 RepID=L8WID5_THACA|nr:hypothetical protein AG1IA_09477 [Rhizoctonia solani AG-1 IA]